MKKNGRETYSSPNRKVENFTDDIIECFWALRVMYFRYQLEVYIVNVEKSFNCKEIFAYLE